MPRRTSSGAARVAARYELVRELRSDPATVDWEAVDTALDRQVRVQLLRQEFANEPTAIEQFWQQARAAARRPAAIGERVLDAGTDPETGQLFVVRDWPAAPAADALGRKSAPPEATLARQRLSRFEVGKGGRWLFLGGLVVALIVAALAIRPGVEGWLNWVNTPQARVDRGFGLGPAVAAVPGSGAQANQSGSSPAAAPATAAPARSAANAATVATPLPTRAATATPNAPGQTRRIVNTDGRGVALRAAAGGDRLPGKGYDEGVTVQAFEQSGEWTRIRGSDGREGWVLSVTLAP